MQKETESRGYTGRQMMVQNSSTVFHSVQLVLKISGRDLINHCYSYEPRIFQAWWLLLKEIFSSFLIK